MNIVDLLINVPFGKMLQHSYHQCVDNGYQDTIRLTVYGGICNTHDNQNSYFIV